MDRLRRRQQIEEIGAVELDAPQLTSREVTEEDLPPRAASRLARPGRPPPRKLVVTTETYERSSGDIDLVLTLGFDDEEPASNAPVVDLDARRKPPP